jgi:O-antigen ligase
VASFFVSQNQDRALNYILDLAKDIAIGICIYITLNSKEKWKGGINVLLFAVAFASILGVIHTLTGSSQTFWGLAQQSAYGQTSDSGELRYGGPIAESNIWGQVLVSILPIALYRFSRARSSLSKMLTASASLFILLAMLFTQSRGAFLALVIVLIFIAIDLKIKSSTLLVMASIGLLLLFLVPSKYTERFRNLDTLFQSSSEGVVQDESVEGRREKMLTGLAMFADRPFLGVGFANYSEHYWSYAGSLGLESSTRNINAETTQRQPHSLYIEIMAETGLFGIATFLGFLGLLLGGLYQTRSKINENQKNPDPDWPAWISSLMMSIFTFLVAGFFLHGIGFRFIWVLAGLALAALHLAPTPHYSIKHK